MIEPPPSICIQSRSPDDTRAVGRRLGELSSGGEVFALHGPLGAGKTCFAQGIAAGLDIDGPIASPTYLIHRWHQGRLTLHHFDLYRLDVEEDLESVGLFDFIAESNDAVVALEWADKFSSRLWPDAIEARFRMSANENERILEIVALGAPPRWWSEFAGERVES